MVAWARPESDANDFAVGKYSANIQQRTSLLSHVLRLIYVGLYRLDREEAAEFLKRSFLHPGKTKCEEQKREASEKYEERCEPSVNKLTGSRYCKALVLDMLERRDVFCSFLFAAAQVRISRRGTPSRTMK